MPHAANLRIGRFSEAGRVYMITTATADRVPVFSDFVLARQVVRALRECDRAGETRTLCFVVMPDHLHWLIELTAEDLSRPVRRFKSTSSRWINSARATPGAPLWQAGFHDHAMRREEDMPSIARYIVANPLRAGLAGNVGEYPHWDAAWL
jgi:putative transposase